MKTRIIQSSMIAVQMMKYLFYSLLVGVVIWAGPMAFSGPFSGDALSAKRAATAIIYASISFALMVVSYFVFFAWIKWKKPRAQVSGELIQRLQFQAWEGFKDFQTRNFFRIILGLLAIAFILVLIDSFA